MRWSVSEVDDSNVSDQERKCASVRMYCTAKTDDERFDVARRCLPDCKTCVRQPFCYVETLMSMFPVGGE